jgi:hypothetical protein
MTDQRISPVLLPYVNIELSEGTEQSSNEIDHLAMAIQRLNTSVSLATEQLRKLSTPTRRPPS